MQSPKAHKTYSWFLRVLKVPRERRSITGAAIDAVTSRRRVKATDFEGMFSYQEQDDRSTTREGERPAFWGQEVPLSRYIYDSSNPRLASLKQMMLF